MLAVLAVSPQSLAHPPSSDTLARMAADHELVLVCDYDTAPRLVRAVRLLLPRHRVIALLVDRALLCHEHDLLEQILNDGHLQVVLTTGEATAVQVSAWLRADTGVVLTAGPARHDRTGTCEGGGAGSGGPWRRRDVVRRPLPRPLVTTVHGFSSAGILPGYHLRDNG